MNTATTSNASSSAEYSGSSSLLPSSQSKQQTSLPEWRKRKHESEGGKEEPEPKQAKVSYFIVLESESDLPTDEDTESERSIQGKETDLPKDTSDTSSSSSSSRWSESESSVPIEYEIETSSEKPTVHSGSFSSGTDDLVRTVGVIAAVLDDDLGLFADSSDCDSERGFHPEFPPYYWKCVQCKNRNSNPMYGYCEKCFRLRKSCLPPRPRKRKPKKKMKSKAPTVPSNSDLCTVVDNTLTKTSSELTVDSGYQCSEPASPQPSTSREMLETEDGPELCITCLSRPKNGIFVHVNKGHICCCYKCALRVWQEQGRCPLCHGKVMNVLQAFKG